MPKLVDLLLNFVFGARSLINRCVDYPFEKDFFGTIPRGDKTTYRNLHKNVTSKKSSLADDREVQTGFAIDHTWLNELALHTQVTIKNSPLDISHGRLLYSLLREYISIAKSPVINIIETGTARGFSALCMAKALHDANVPGTVITIDVLPHLRSQYWNCIDDHDGKRTRRELLTAYSGVIDRVVFIRGDTLTMLPRIGIDRVHFAYLDAQHTKKNVLEEYSAVKRLQSAGDILFFDDVTPKKFQGVVDAVKKIEREGQYSMEYLQGNHDRSFAIGTHS